MDLLRASSSQRAGELGVCAKADSVKSDAPCIRLTRYLSDGKPSFLNPAFESLKSVKKVLDIAKKQNLIITLTIIIIIIIIRCWST